MKFRFIAKEKLSALPSAPGVYALSSSQEILYIGKALNLKERIRSHFQQPSYRDHLFIKHITKVGCIETFSEIDALLLESQLIKKYQPKYNVMWKDGKNYFYLALTKEPLPRVLILHQVSKGSFSKFLGPFVDGKSLKQTLKLLRRVFPYYTAKKHPEGLCSWCHIALCPGPNPNKKKYRKDLRSLFEVLQGKRISVIKNIKKAMEIASKDQRFEEAAVLRNQFLALENVASHFHEQTLPKNSEKELQKILRSKNPINRIEAYDISNIQGAHATGSMVTFINGRPAKDWYRKFKVHISGKPNDFAMIQEVISRRMAHKEWPYPDLMLIDGGKGQLSSALQTLNLIKLSYSQRFRVAALAKKHDELFLPKSSVSLLLKDMPPEARNVLLHIRDEAHRFAIAYHRKLRRVDLLKPL
ncbi:MAG: GIY-YIG nuclease family protein [Candidatus Wildermuthbacteria bacterium]|nr:GIY-YIG nuclease family protein [Candidatus Wildermuthbacteria bacterium]